MNATISSFYLFVTCNIIIKKSNPQKTLECVTSVREVLPDKLLVTRDT